MQTVYNDFPQTFNCDSSTWRRCENSFDHLGHPPCFIPFLFQGCKPRNQSICLNPIIFFYFIDKICTKVRAEYSITTKSYLEIVFKILMNVSLQHQQTKALSTEQLKIQMTNQSGASHRIILSHKITSPLSTKRSNPTTHRILHLAIPLSSFYQLLNIHLDRELELKFYKILMSNLIVVLFQISNM